MVLTLETQNPIRMEIQKLSRTKYTAIYYKVTNVWQISTQEFEEVTLGYVEGFTEK